MVAGGMVAAGAAAAVMGGAAGAGVGVAWGVVQPAEAANPSIKARAMGRIGLLRNVRVARGRVMS
jgi:hypothetical protein